MPRITALQLDELINLHGDEVDKSLDRLEFTGAQVSGDYKAFRRYHLELISAIERR